MRALALSAAVLALAFTAPAWAEGPAPKAAAPAAPADKPVEEAAPPKDSPLPVAMFMAGAGVGAAAVGGYLAFGTDDLGSKRLGVPLMIGGGLSAAAGVALIVLSSKEPAKAGRAPRRIHTLSVGPASAAYSYRF
ncbi:MAG: hypothetical protein L6Q84_16350 [Polyangiaceae bacterium]|nr:hypothetical protein [Polyangiaceae bacterium]